MKNKKSLIALAIVAGFCWGCADDGVDPRITNPTPNNEGFVDEVPQCVATERDYSSLDARFPWAGDQRFYRLDPDEFCDTVGQVLLQVEEAEPIEDPKVFISPHAGWQFSGIITASYLSRVNVPDLIILIGNNHKDNGENNAVYADGAWALPSGDVPVDAEVASMLLENVPQLVADKVAHSEEHSIEMQMMWLTRFNPNIRVVPIAFDYNNLDELKSIGKGIAATLKELDEEYMVIATTDLTHYQPLEVANERDTPVIERMVAMDPDGLFELVSSDRSKYNMCGLEPSIIGMVIAEELGATSGELVKRLTSADGNGNTEKVVGYAGVVFK